MTTGPESPGQPDEVTKGRTVKVIQLEVLSCSSCEKDSLFARVLDAESGKEHHFCSRCGNYFEIPIR